MKMLKAIKLERISKSFPDRNKKSLLPVLQEIDLEVNQQEFVSLIGPSGCGKSTLFNIISGLLLPDEGQVLINGEPANGKTGLVSYMPQKDLLLPWRTTLDNVIIPLEIRKMDKNRARQKARDLFPLFGLEGFESSYPHQLSGGMRQRAALLRTYLNKSEIMLLDEPFASLDAITKSKLHGWLQEIWARFRPSILFITHDIDEAIFLADRIYVLSERPADIKGHFQVELPRPRTAKSLTAAEFLRLKEKLLELL